jgi:Flp pilus assembly protein TadD
MNRKQRRAGTVQSGPLQKTESQAVAALFAEAVAHSKVGRSNAAITCFRRATKIAPDFAAAHYNLGNALGEQGQHGEAITCFLKAIALAPGLAEAHSNLGAALRHQGQLEEAATCYKTAIELAPQFPLAYFNFGTVLEEQRHMDEAAACYRKAINLQPDFAVAHHNLAMVLLTLGDMEAGWQEYEWRWKTPQMAGEARNFLQPQWRGEPAVGKTLLIHAEQGFGDNLQFCRYAPLAAARGLRVIMEAPKPLVRLFQSLPGIDQIITAGEPLPSFDLHCPMMSLPLASKTTMATIPAAPAYLFADPAKIKHWQIRLEAAASQGKRIGLVWAGRSKKGNRAHVEIDRRRSISLKQLAPFFELPGLLFFSLQKDKSAEAEFLVIDFMTEMADFADTASLIANLDLVISVDTAIAHLAAALGKPVWLLNRFNSDWRWLDGRRGSLWYPSLRLYSQPCPNDWASVVTEISNDLRGFAVGETFHQRA